MIAINFFAKVILLFGITKFFPDYVKEIRQIMEYVQLEGIHIHEDGYAKFIELTLIIYDVKTTVPVNLLINFALARPSTALFVGGLNGTT